MLEEERYSNLKIAGEIYPVNCDKGSAMLEATQEFGYTSENCYAFGDSNNDVSMCKNAG